MAGCWVNVPRAPTLCAGLFFVLSLTACDGNDSLDTCSEQPAVCDLAQDNGLLDNAVARCAVAMEAAADSLSTEAATSSTEPIRS